MFIYALSVVVSMLVHEVQFALLYRFHQFSLDHVISSSLACLSESSATMSGNQLDHVVIRHLFNGGLLEGLGTLMIHDVALNLPVCSKAWYSVGQRGDALA